MVWWKRLLGFPEKKVPTAAAPSSPWEAAAEPRDDFDSGFDLRRRRGGGHTAWVWLRTIAVALIVVAGVWQVVVKPIRSAFTSDETTSVAPHAVDLGHAGSVASSFAVDYLAYGGASYAAHRAAAIGQWVDSRYFADASNVGQMEGQDVLIADSPSVDGAQAVGEHGAVVAVRLRVRTFVPDPSGPSGTTAEVPAPPTTGAAAYVPTVPAGYIAGPAFWVRLLVPVTEQGSRLVVAGPGPVFSAEGLAPVSVGQDVDPSSTSKVAHAAEAIMTAYAAGDVTYVAAEGSSLQGLAGAVGLDSIQDTTVAATGTDRTR